LLAGQQALSVRRDNMDVASMFDAATGLVSDWDALAAVVSHALGDRLRVNSSEHPILLGEPSHNTRAVRPRQIWGTM
jgi:actin-like protein 6A